VVHTYSIESDNIIKCQIKPDFLYTTYLGDVSVNKAKLSVLKLDNRQLIEQDQQDHSMHW